MTDNPRPATSPLDAVADMRASAKWILAAATAAGAALLGGGPLAAVGKVHTAGTVAAAYGGLILGLIGIGWAIWCTADAMIPPLTTPKSLDTDPRMQDLRDRIASDTTAFYGPFGTSMADLAAVSTFHLKVAANLANALAAEVDPARRQILTAGLEEARATSAAIQRRTQTLLELTHAWDVRVQLRRARLHAFGGAALAALGVVMFVAATSTPATTKAPSISPGTQTISPQPSPSR